MTTVVGLDLSLRATGIAVIDHPDQASTPNMPRLHTVGENGRRNAATLDRAKRLSRTAKKVLAHVPEQPALAVIEGPAFASHHGAAHERSGLYWTVIMALGARRIPVAVCPPATLKRYATGTGAADKTQVLDAMRHHWTTAHITNDNESDALALATAGAMRLQWWPPETDHHETALAAIEWPTGLTDTLATRLQEVW